MARAAARARRPPRSCRPRSEVRCRGRWRATRPSGGRSSAGRASARASVGSPLRTRLRRRVLPTQVAMRRRRRPALDVSADHASVRARAGERGQIDAELGGDPPGQRRRADPRRDRVWGGDVRRRRVGQGGCRCGYGCGGRRRAAAMLLARPHRSRRSPPRPRRCPLAAALRARISAGMLRLVDDGGLVGLDLDQRLPLLDSSPSATSQLNDGALLHRVRQAWHDDFDGQCLLTPGLQTFAVGSYLKRPKRVEKEPMASVQTLRAAGGEAATASTRGVRHGCC